jgi:crotonobetainyl-CoA:carnitine CoA-transferase CaiB-like acyl-CoA transferase
MGEGLLSGFRTLDLTDDKGFMSGKILAAMGSDVIKVEKPGGDPSRSIPPFYGADTEESLYWLMYNTDKRGITLNIETKRGQTLFEDLIKRSDFVLESFTPGYLNDLDLGYETLSRWNKKIIMTSITPFGQKGPYSRFKGNELILSAMSGVLLCIGFEDRPPVKEGLDANYFHANGAAALGTIMAHYDREKTGEGQQLDVSIQEVGVSRNTNNILPFLYDKRLIKRSGQSRRLGLNSHKWIWRVKDGDIFWSMMPGKVGAPANRALSKWMDDDGLENPLREVENWEKLDREGLNQEKRAVWERAIGRFFLNHTKKEIAEEGRRRGINAAVANTPEDVVTSPQLRARNYWTTLDHFEPGLKTEYPKHFFLCSETENVVNRRAPFVGEHNQEIFGKELGLQDSELASLKNLNVM